MPGSVAGAVDLRSASRERAALLAGWVSRSVDGGRAAWFGTTLSSLSGSDHDPDLLRAVGLASRKLGKDDIVLSRDDLVRADQARPGFDPTGLTVDQAARIAFVLAADRGDERRFASQLAELHATADLGESIAYLRGLPLFPAARELLPLAGEGVRSAVKPVFEAVAHRSPYPAEMFDQGAWNQMVVKALFVGSSLAPIQRLAERANPELAEILIDYAHERWAAGRPVSPELWLCVGPFAEGRALDDLERVLATGTPDERAAARAALQANPAAEAGAILARHAGPG